MIVENSGYTSPLPLFRQGQLRCQVSQVFLVISQFYLILPEPALLLGKQVSDEEVVPERLTRMTMVQAKTHLWAEAIC